MEQIRRMFEERNNKLLKMREIVEKNLESVPEGKLRICTGIGKKPRYFLREDPKDFSGTYILAENSELARRLAQKSYDEKLLRSINQELRATERYLAAVPKLKAEDVYETLHPERQNLITPICETDEQFVEKWENEKYQGKEIDDTVPLIYTAQGKRVRSKSEVIIADAMHTETVPYRYECPLRLHGLGIIYPDFTTLNVRKREEIYWEHLGMMDNPEYAERALKKISIYEENGIYIGERLIVTWETQRYPLDPRKVRALIKKYLK